MSWRNQSSIHHSSLLKKKKKNLIKLHETAASQFIFNLKAKSIALSAASRQGVNHTASREVAALIRNNNLVWFVLLMNSPDCCGAGVSSFTAYLILIHCVWRLVQVSPHRRLNFCLLLPVVCPHGKLPNVGCARHWCTACKQQSFLGPALHDKPRVHPRNFHNLHLNVEQHRTEGKEEMQLFFFSCTDWRSKNQLLTCLFKYWLEIWGEKTFFL